MRIALLYPPPWKLPAPGEPADGSADGPPAGFREGDLDADFHQAPHGLLSLAAQAVRAGHDVKVLNLSAFPWRRAEEVLGALEADVWGLSCWTANRRGVEIAARAIKRLRPRAHVVLGGPHATPLAPEILSRWPYVDSVVAGEGETTFLDLVERLAAGRSLAGLPGALWREDGRVVRGPPREVIRDLDSLASAHDLYDTHIVMTARGCPWSCTFCGAETAWGRGWRAHSTGRVLDVLERLAARLPVKMVQIKDDTFTTNARRVLGICRGIRDRGIRLLWSCDTRVDVLSEELVREMRLAGCERLSLGVESGAPAILRAIDKKITPEQIVRSTEMARAVGLRVRYYMMLGNRGETEATFRETLDFLRAARPDETIFSCLSIYPGTRDFRDAVAAGRLGPEVYFEGDFQELKAPFDASEELTARMDAWFRDHSGIRRGPAPSLDERRATLARLGDHPPAHLDVAVAAHDAGLLDEADRHARRALDLGHPAPGLALNLLACVARARGDVDAMMDRFTEAARRDPQHPVLVRNVAAARTWFRDHGPRRGLPLDLVARHDFEILERAAQPMLPGPLPDDFAMWSQRECV